MDSFDNGEFYSKLCLIFFFNAYYNIYDLRQYNILSPVHTSFPP